MAILRIDHVLLAMPRGGEERARTFYCDVLGLTEVPKPPHLAVRGGAWFESGSARIHLGVEDDFRPAVKAHPGVVVDDLDAIAARCLNGGFRIVRGEGVEEMVQVYVFDPFGNRLELLQAPDAAVKSA